MNENIYTCTAKVWRYPGVSGWHFVSVPKKQSAAIRKAFAGLGRGFGALPVSVTLGMSTWHTSIFPDSKTGTYLLALKAEVRKKEKIGEGSEARFSFSIRMSEF